MRIKKTLPDGHNVFSILNVIGFLFAFSLTLPLYVNSSFLSQFASEGMVGILYTTGSILTIILIAAMGYTLRRFGNYAVTAVVMFATSILLAVLAFADTIFLVAPVFIVYAALLSIIFFNLDIFLERYSDDRHTGNIRGKFLTSINVAYILGPLSAGILLSNSEFWKVYIIASISIALTGILLITHFRSFKDPKYDRVPLWKTMRIMWENKDIWNIYMCNLFLRFFFAWMVIYTPIYLHEYIGFSWGEIGMILTIMLLPFVLFELPAGRLADKQWGEKELLILGFIITALSTGVLYFITEKTFWIWAVMLFITRIGASLIEIMTESYFFKHIDATDVNVLAFFRNNRPVAYAVAPIAATILLVFIDFRGLFVVLGVILLFGLRYALVLKDTK